MFQLNERTVLLSNFNPRVENNGPKDKKPAADLKITLNMPSDDLALFHPDLKASLYHLDKSRAGDLVDDANAGDPNYAPHLRFPKLGSLAWDLSFGIAQVTIAYGVKKPIELPDCKVNNFSFTPQEGGTVIASFRIQGHPDGAAAGKLYDLQTCEITLSVEATDAADLLDDEKEEEPGK